eukprot:1610839-Pyramimonas_sp.AAC.1
MSSEAIESWSEEHAKRFQGVNQDEDEVEEGCSLSIFSKRNAWLTCGARWSPPRALKGSLGRLRMRCPEVGGGGRGAGELRGG